MRVANSKIFLPLSLVTLLFASCNESVEKSASRKSTETSSDTGSEEESDDEQSLNFTVIIPAGGAGFAKLGKNKVLMDAGTSTVDVRITMKRQSLSELDDEDASVLSGSEVVDVAVTDANSGDFLDPSSLKNPLRIQTDIRSSAAESGEYYVALVLKDNRSDSSKYERTSIAGGSTKEAASSSQLYLAASPKREFNLRSAHFVYGIVYDAEVDPRFGQSSLSAESGETSITAASPTVGVGSGNFSFKTSVGQNGFITLTGTAASIISSAKISDESFIACGNASSSTPVRAVALSVRLMGNSFGTESSFGQNGVATYNFGDASKCSKIRNAGGSVNYAGIVKSSNGNLEAQIVPVSVGSASNGFGNALLGKEVVTQLDGLSDFYVSTDSQITFLTKTAINQSKLTRYDSTGNRVTNFGTSGEVSLDTGVCRDLIVNAAGTMLMVCSMPSSTNGKLELRVVKVRQNGYLEMNFGSSGKTVAVAYANSSGNATNLFWKGGTDDKITAVGYTDNGGVNKKFFFVQKYLASGSVDASFGVNGYVQGSTDDFQTYDALQSSDGNFIYLCGVKRDVALSSSAMMKYDVVNNTSQIISSTQISANQMELLTCHFRGTDEIFGLIGGGNVLAAAIANY